MLIVYKMQEFVALIGRPLCEVFCVCRIVRGAQVPEAHVEVVLASGTRCFGAVTSVPEDKMARSQSCSHFFLSNHHSAPDIISSGLGDY